MKYDLNYLAAPLDSEQLKQIPAFIDCRTNRGKAETWAANGCQFLIYDDTNTETDKVTHHKGGTDAHTGLKNSITKAAPDPTCSIENSTTCTNERHVRCLSCSSLPEFPHDRVIQSLRLARPGDNSIKACCHYVAVSYARALHCDSQSQGSYRVRHQDGTIRRNRTPDAVLSHAIDFAVTAGLKMIWIDSECLPEDKHQRELGTQAMDIVFQRAFLTAAVLSNEISSPEQMTALQKLESSNARNIIAKDGALSADQVDEETFLQAAYFLEEFHQDAWCSCPWTIQDLLSSRPRFFFVFPRGTGVPYEKELCMLGRVEPPEHPLHTKARVLPSQIVFIFLPDLEKMLPILRDCASAFNRHQPVEEFIWEPLFAHPACEIIDAVSVILKQDSTPQEPIITVHAPKDRNFRKTVKVDAAGALSLMKHRHNLSPEHVISILANICQYDTRLEIQNLLRSCDSLRVALLCLSLLNGDLSLLVPETYNIPFERSFQASTELHIDVPSWLSPFHQQFNNIDHVGLTAWNGLRYWKPRYEKGSFLFPAYLWTVTDKVSLNPIKTKWEDAWIGLRDFVIRLSPGPDKDASHDYWNASRAPDVAKYLHDPIRELRVKKELFQHGSIPADSHVWRGIDKSGITVTPVSIAQSLDRDRSGLRARIFATFIFDILRFLHQEAESGAQPLAGGFANSIWQSLRVGTVPGHSPPLPDLVSEKLFNHSVVKKNPLATIHLDKSRNGEFNQVWLFDRIIRDGSVWTGRYRGETQKCAEATEYDSKKIRPILERQRTREVMAGMVAMAIDNSDTRQVTTEVGDFVGFSATISEGIWTKEAEEIRKETLVSAFDVDDRCIVATPFTSEWEVIPHPTLRSMSVCWVVEESGNYIDRKGKGTVNNAQPVGHSVDDDGSEDAELSSPHHQGSYRVINKVKGVWQIMDLPEQRYCFD